jgi:hypothetical protein
MLPPGLQHVRLPSERFRRRSVTGGQRKINQLAK